MPASAMCKFEENRLKRPDEEIRRLTFPKSGYILFCIWQWRDQPSYVCPREAALWLWGRRKTRWKPSPSLPARSWTRCER